VIGRRRPLGLVARRNPNVPTIESTLIMRSSRAISCRPWLKKTSEIRVIRVIRGQEKTSEIRVIRAIRG
jgi:hypothetical protein